MPLDPGGDRFKIAVPISVAGVVYCGGINIAIIPPPMAIRMQRAMPSIITIARFGLEKRFFIVFLLPMA